MTFTDGRHFWAIQIMLLALIVMYCTMHELVRVIGREKVLRIFFGPMPLPQVYTTAFQLEENAWETDK
jgi:hypothetical protein